MSKSIVITDPHNAELEAEPIPTEWILGGNPQARSKKLMRSLDYASWVIVWECTAGQFYWHYPADETILVISGEAFMINEKGEEVRFGPGEVGFFPAGSSCTWRVPDGIRKIGVLRESMWRPLGLCLKIWKKSLRLAGFAKK